MPMLLDLVHVTRRYSRRGFHPEVLAVADFNLSVLQGEFVTLLGPPGSGKTTVLRMIAGLEHPNAGEIRQDGQIINNLPPDQRQTALVFQDAALFPYLSIYENVAYGLRLRKLPKVDIANRVAQALEVTGLQNLGNRRAGQLSGDQTQRVALARALSTGSQTLLLDDPFSPLKTSLRETWREEVRQIQHTLGITILCATQDAQEALALSDRVVVMLQGRIQQAGTAQDIYLRPQTPFVARYTGKANFLEGIIIRQTDKAWEIELLHQRYLYPANQLSQDWYTGLRLIFVARPEMIDLAPASARPALKGTVNRTRFLGDTAEYEITAAGQLLLVRDAQPHAHPLYQVQSEVSLDLTAEWLCPLPVGKE
ncbi:MAG: ABC transporter ATP-binding protein [Chloroflexi bacterium]|nr:ABC transporter ATP-binding protein [Chloroflexota bacterium]